MVMLPGVSGQGWEHGYGRMVLSLVPRHKRREFTFKVGAAPCGILSSLYSSGILVEDEFDLPSMAVQRTNEYHDDGKLLSMLATQIQTEHAEDFDFSPSSDELSVQRAGAKILAKIAGGSSSANIETAALIENMRRRLAELDDFEEDAEQNDLDFSVDQQAVYPSGMVGSEPYRPDVSSPHRMHLHVEIMPAGNRIETFGNGSRICKDSLGRVMEIFSRFGDSLFFTYGECGEIATFTRVDAHGKVHSRGKKGQHSVTVRDAEGRVKAIGESMTVDPWGCFYLHTRDGQYFCVDLVGGIHSERRRLLTHEGKVEYITSAFSHDGFRMATLYASVPSGAPSVSPLGGALRLSVYRFYGRDGSAVEFPTDDHFRNLSPSRSLPPATFPVHSSWLTTRQAHTAWESVKEYLSRVS